MVPSWFKETLDKRLFKAPYEYAVETAKQKALEVARRMPLVSLSVIVRLHVVSLGLRVKMSFDMFQQHRKTPDIVIGADTIVVRGTKYTIAVMLFCCYVTSGSYFHRR